MRGTHASASATADGPPRSARRPGPHARSRPGGRRSGEPPPRRGRPGAGGSAGSRGRRARPSRRSRWRAVLAVRGVGQGQAHELVHLAVDAGRTRSRAPRAARPRPRGRARAAGGSPSSASSRRSSARARVTVSEELLALGRAVSPASGGVSRRRGAVSRTSCTRSACTSSNEAWRSSGTRARLAARTRSRPGEKAVRGRQARSGSPARDAADDVGRVVAREGLPAGDELVDDGADREDVGAAVRPAPDQELGRPVVQPLLGRPRPRRSSAFRCHEPKSTILHLAGRRHAHVGGLEVEVQDALAVGVGEALADLPPQVEHPLDRQRRVAAQHLGEAHPCDELRRHPGPALVLPDVEHRGDVRVIERTGAPGRRAAGARWRGRLLRDRGEELDRGRRPRLGVPAVEDDAAPPRPSSPRTSKGTERLRAFHRASRRAILCCRVRGGRRAAVLSWTRRPW